MRRLAPLAILLATAAAVPQLERPPKDRVIGPLRDLRRFLRETVFVLRRSPGQIRTAAAMALDHLDERGLEPGCHVRRSEYDAALEGERLLEWFVGQLPRIAVDGKGDRELVVHWTLRALDQVGEQTPVAVVTLTPKDVEDLDPEQVRKLAAAERRRERRAGKRKAFNMDDALAKFDGEEQ